MLRSHPRDSDVIGRVRAGHEALENPPGDTKVQPRLRTIGLFGHGYLYGPYVILMCSPG